MIIFAYLDNHQTSRVLWRSQIFPWWTNRVERFHGILNLTLDCEHIKKVFRQVKLEYRREGKPSCWFCWVSNNQGEIPQVPSTHSGWSGREHFSDYHLPHRTPWCRHIPPLAAGLYWQKGPDHRPLRRHCPPLPLSSVGLAQYWEKIHKISDLPECHQNMSTSD